MLGTLCNELMICSLHSAENISDFSLDLDFLCVFASLREIIFYDCKPVALIAGMRWFSVDQDI